MPNGSEQNDAEQNQTLPLQFTGDRSTRPLYQYTWWKMAALGLTGASLFLIMTLLSTLFPS